MIARPELFTPEVPRQAPADDVLAGLQAARKRLPCRLLYDERGAELFDRICTLPEYYPTRSEVALLAQHLPKIAREIGPHARVIEPGSGSARKTRMLLAALDRPAAYVPIDVSGDQLEAEVRALRRELPWLDVQPVHGDYMAVRSLPASRVEAARSLVFFPGSTIGNLEPDAARAFLARFRGLAGASSRLLLGADANQDADSLLRAYDDRAGVTAAFDLNVLAHVNRVYGANFDRDRFAHRAVWDPRLGRIEMHLVSCCAQTVEVAGQPIRFARGEPIVTEHSYKHRPEVMAALLAGAGWHVCEVFCDPRSRMRLWLAADAAGKLGR